MELSHPNVTRDFCSDLDQTLDDPFHSPFDFFAHEVSATLILINLKQLIHLSQCPFFLEH